MLQAARGQSFDDQLKQFSEFYDDFNCKLLQAQLNILQSVVAKFDAPSSVLAIAQIFKQKPGRRVLLSEVWRHTKLLMVVPASAATAERSF